MGFGKIVWHDITVNNNEKIRDFYTKIAGWDYDSVDMDGYNDFSMLDKDKNPVSGICKRTGVNKDVPTGWVMYIVVEDLAESLKQVVENGGEIVNLRVSEGNMSGMAFIKDPEGNVCCLYKD
ncbi:MAG: VOC family protein [Candidatus Delongbacteria bacterium]|nr:VOC family protein [Candidatus Delongbacteria bacterium]MBN2834198.1 VOC family protein [Candidatus Delongbacteria bacterium]